MKAKANTKDGASAEANERTRARNESERGYARSRDLNDEGDGNALTSERGARIRGVKERGDGVKREYKASFLYGKRGEK